MSLALTGGLATSVLGSQARPLRHLLFRLVTYHIYDKMPGNSVICNSSLLVWFSAVILVRGVVIFNTQLKKTVFQNTCMLDVDVRIQDVVSQAIQFFVRKWFY